MTYSKAGMESFQQSGLKTSEQRVQKGAKRQERKPFL